MNYESWELEKKLSGAKVWNLKLINKSYEIDAGFVEQQRELYDARGPNKLYLLQQYPSS